MTQEVGETGKDVTVNVADHLDDNEISSIIEGLEKSDIQDTERYALNELFSGQDSSIMFKTELNEEQIKQITKILTADKIAKIQSKHDNEATPRAQKELQSVVETMVFTMMRLSVSKNRKGRFEFMESFKKAAGEMRDNLMQRWLNFGE